MILERGAWPVRFPAEWNVAKSLTFALPGVVRVPGGVGCAWDAAPVVARLLGQPAPTLRDPDVSDFPGLASYQAAGLSAKLRDYQKEAAAFVAARGHALLSLPMRAGKTRTALAAGLLADAERTLVIAPALAKWVWVDEILAVLPGSTVAVLDGRAATVARVVCCDCNGRGRTPTGEKCPACKRSLGYRIARGPDEVREVVNAATYVVANYDILVAQHAADAAGKEFVRDDLPGWGGVLAAAKFDLAILDECHLLRGFSTAQQRRGQTRRERTRDAVHGIPRVWGLTGTPIYGFVRDLWGQLDVLSGGLWGELPFNAHARYCEGRKGQYGWVADGRSNEAELAERLSVIMLKRDRSEILAQLPPKTLEVVRIDVEAKRAAAVDLGVARGQAVAKALREATWLKLDAVVDRVVADLAEGNRVLVYALLRDAAKKIHDALADEIASPEHAARMRNVNPRLWLATGEQDAKVRFEFARAFREWTGAGAFVATIDAVQVAISLRGASTVHFASLHYSPAALLQAMDRPYEPDTNGLSVVFYVARGTVDEAIEAVVLPKLRTVEEVGAEKGAGALRTAFAGEEETLDAIWTRLTGHVADEKEVA